MSLCAKSHLNSVMFVWNLYKKFMENCSKTPFSRIFLERRKLHVWPPSLQMLSLKGWETTRSPSTPTGGSRRAKETLESRLSEENWKWGFIQKYIWKCLCHFRVSNQIKSAGLSHFMSSSVLTVWLNYYHLYLRNKSKSIIMVFKFLLQTKAIYTSVQGF